MQTNKRCQPFHHKKERNGHWVFYEKDHYFTDCDIFSCTMHKQNQGYGICGAKNMYSSKVKLDNWVEDDIGAVLALRTEQLPHSYDTVQSSSHRHPNQWPAATHPPLNVPSTQELKAKNKEGMPYSLLFDHGIREEKADVIYCIFSCANLTFACRIGSQPRRCLQS